MRKQTGPSQFRYLCTFVGLGLLTFSPSAVATSHHGVYKGVTSAQAVTKRVATTSRQLDPDRDGLTSRTEERKTKTNPRQFDTDGDGFGDGAEVLAGTNPLSASSVPLGPSAPPPESPTSPPDDTTAPDTTISSGPSGSTTSTDASLGFISSESSSSFQCSLDSGS